jgi:S1-C subfamily serine protease
MRRCVLLSVAALATLGTAAAADPSGGRSAREARRAVAVVYCGSRLVGSATLVGDGQALTCRHVVRRRYGLRVAFLNGGEAPCTVVDEDEALDLALLRLEAPERRPALRLAAAVPEVGDPVWAVGHPEGYLFSILSGVVSADGRQIEMPDGPVLGGVLQTDAPISQGCSGGPLLNASGEVVGLVLATSRDARGVSFALPAPVLRRFLDTRHEAVTAEQTAARALSHAR